MMSQPVVQKRLRIEALSPLHVGSGEKLRRKDFAQRGDQLFVVDSRKLLERIGISPRLSEDFLAFCEDEQKRLSDFLTESRIRFEDVKAYQIAALGRVGREIFAFIKTIDGFPFLPGSSIKGALRSAVLQYAFLSQEALFNDVRRDVTGKMETLEGELKQDPKARNRITKKWKQKISDAIEQSFFGPDQHHDLMRCIQIADSRPVDSARLQVAEVKVLSTSGSQLLIKQTKAGRDVPINPEVIRKGTVFECPLSFHVNLLSNGEPSRRLKFHPKSDTILSFPVACHKVAERLIQQEIAFYRNYGQTELTGWYQKLQHQLTQLKPNQCLLHVAWGSGFDAKTVTDLFSDELFHEIRQAFNLGKFELDQQGKRRVIRPFPKTRKIIFEHDNAKEPLGWVKLTVEEES
jgi:CRISPR-associated protein Csm5